jgi:hypothetical protein
MIITLGQEPGIFIDTILMSDGELDQKDGGPGGINALARQRGWIVPTLPFGDCLREGIKIPVDDDYLEHAFLMARSIESLCMTLIYPYGYRSIDKFMTDREAIENVEDDVYSYVCNCYVVVRSIRHLVKIRFASPAIKYNNLALTVRDSAGLYAPDDFDFVTDLF